MFALRTIEREGGGVRARWQNFRTRIPLLWVKTFYSGLWLKKNLFQMLLAPLCPRVTRSSARSRGARFSFQLWRAGFNAGSSDLGSIPAIANSSWSSISFDENLYASISSLVRAKREVLVDFQVIGCWSSFSMDWVRSRLFWTLFISFLLWKKTFCAFSLFCPRETASPTRIFFGS